MNPRGPTDVSVYQVILVITVTGKSTNVSLISVRMAEDVLMKSMVSGAFALPAIMELFASITLTTARLQEEIHAKMEVYVSTVKTNTSVDVSLDLLDHFVK